MWDTPKIKINLKALSPQDIKETSEILVPEKIDKTEISQISSNTKEELIAKDISDDTLSLWEAVKAPKETSKETDSKKHSISFADIKKQIENKSTPSISKEKEQEEEWEEKEILWDTAIKTSSWEDIKIENSEASTQDSESNTDKTISNIQDIVHNNVWENIVELKEDSGTNESEQIESSEAIVEIKKEEWIEKKSSFFSKFKRKKTENINKESKNLAENISQTDEKSSDEKINTQAPEKIHFSNYESHFKKESTNFLKKFQNFKYTPSTRVGMILWLITFTTISIATLMIVFPEKHSIDIYKASLLEVAWKNSQQPEIESPDDSILNPTNENIQIIEEENINIPQENINSINLQEDSKEKLRQHLLNKYK